MKTVKVVLEVPAPLMRRITRFAKTLGIDAATRLPQELLEGGLIESTADDPDFWWENYVYPSREVAQKAVDAYFRSRKPDYPLHRTKELSFMEDGKRKRERFWAPGAKKAFRRLERTCLAISRADRKAEAAARIAASLREKATARHRLSFANPSALLRREL